MADSEQRPQKRPVAYKKRIADLIDAKYIKTGGQAANFLQAVGQDISRVNVIAAVVSRADFQNYVNISIDDGTGRISARAFDNTALVSNIKVGDVVMIIGKPREFSSEKYILIEAIKKVSPAWAKFRKIELEGVHGQGYAAKNGVEDKHDKADETETSYSGQTNKIIKVIKELDKGDGVSIDDLLSKGIENADSIIDALLRRGDIFETKPGKIKVLE